SRSSGASCCSITSPSTSPVVVRAVRSISVRYRLSSPTRYCASRVDAPSSTSRSPVANGSSVPACPARAPVRSRSRLTTAKDDGPAGLSARTSPDGLSALGGMRRDERRADELDDLLDRLRAREAGRLAMAAAPALPRDRGDVDL